MHRWLPVEMALFGHCSDWKGEKMNYFRVLVVAAGFAVISAPLSAAGDPLRCWGERATIVGTTGDDTLNGTAKLDVIVGREGNDKIYGSGGPDLICGGPGADSINGAMISRVVVVGTTRYMEARATIP